MPHASLLGSNGLHSTFTSQMISRQIIFIVSAKKCTPQKWSGKKEGTMILLFCGCTGLARIGVTTGTCTNGNAQTCTCVSHCIHTHTLFFLNLPDSLNSPSRSQTHAQLNMYEDTGGSHTHTHTHTHTQH